jgi:hypothetical protein
MRDAALAGFMAIAVTSGLFVIADGLYDGRIERGLRGLVDAYAWLLGLPARARRATRSRLR